MKYLNEYRDAELAKRFLEEIHKTVTKPCSVMEVCGGQTHGLVKYGIIDMLPSAISVVHGPGCPVCVTPISIIDKAIHLVEKEGVLLCSFGDMLRVPGSKKSLLEAKAEGGDVKVLYSPLEAIKVAEDHPDREVVFFAVGFETTAPAIALTLRHAKLQNLKNFSVLASHVLVPPAIRAIMDDENSRVDGFLAAGHVCTIMGNEEYHELVNTYRIPIVVTGFEPLDLLQGILMVVKQLESGTYRVENQYARMVREEGNLEAKKIMWEVFEVSQQTWRGIGEIPGSGLRIKEGFSLFDALEKFQLDIYEAPENKLCISGDIMKGIKKPYQCTQFGKECTPSTPIGAPMVSTEGACAAYYHFQGVRQE